MPIAKKPAAASDTKDDGSKKPPAAVDTKKDDTKAAATPAAAGPSPASGGGDNDAVAKLQDANKKLEAEVKSDHDEKEKQITQDLADAKKEEAEDKQKITEMKDDETKKEMQRFWHTAALAPHNVHWILVFSQLCPVLEPVILPHTIRACVGWRSLVLIVDARHCCPKSLPLPHRVLHLHLSIIGASVCVPSK